MKIKKITMMFLFVCMSLCLSACGNKPLADQQIDEIEIYSSHYAREIQEITVVLTDEEDIEEMVHFFDEFEYREMTEEDDLPEEYVGRGEDIIRFKKDGKTIQTYTLTAFHIYENDNEVPYMIENDEDLETWINYVDKILAGELGTIIEQ